MGDGARLGAKRRPVDHCPVGSEALPQVNLHPAWSEDQAETRVMLTQNIGVPTEQQERYAQASWSARLALMQHCGPLTRSRAAPDLLAPGALPVVRSTAGTRCAASGPSVTRGTIGPVQDLIVGALAQTAPTPPRT